MLVVAAIPAFNEEKTIARVVLVAQRHADKVIVCNDGSQDLTGIIAERLGAEIINHQTNMGKGEALRSIFEAAKKMEADVLVTLDGDGQHDADEIPKLVKLVEEGAADIVVGSRFVGLKSSIPRHREFGNKVLTRVIGEEIRDTQSGFRAYSRRAIQSIVPAEMGMGVDSEILMEAVDKGLQIIEVPISVKYGIGKTSTHNPFYHSLDVFFSIIKLTSIRHPLLFYGGTGLLLMAVGVYFAFRTANFYLTFKVLDSVTIFGGILAFFFGMIGLLAFFTGIILFVMTTIVRKGSQ